MTDSRIRGFERSWKETGSAQDMTAYLRERLRAGGIDTERLRLAAYLGDPAASAALAGGAPAEVSDLGEWSDGLQEWGKMACVRASVAVARLVLPLWERIEPANLQPRKAIEVAEAWLACPCEKHANLAHELTEGDEVSHLVSNCTDEAAEHAVRTARNAAWCAANLEADGCAHDLVWAVSDAVTAASAGGLGEEAPRSAIQASLIPWALGLEADPLDRDGLKALRTAWEVSSSVEDEAAYLAERVRVGDLGRRWLLLAAHLGHPAAKLALDDEAPPPPADAHEWIEGAMSGWGGAVTARIAAALSSLAVSRSERTATRVMLEQAVASALALCDEPENESLQQATRSSLTHLRNAARHSGEASAVGTVSQALQAVRLSLLPSDTLSEEDGPSEGRGDRARSELTSAHRILVEDMGVSSGAVQEHVEQSLIPWATRTGGAIRRANET